MSQLDYASTLVAERESSALSRALSGLVTGDFRIVYIDPNGEWAVERVSTERLARAMMPEPTEDPAMAAVLLQVNRGPVYGTPHAKVLDVQSGRFTKEEFGRRYVPLAIGRVKHPSRLNRLR